MIEKILQLMYLVVLNNIIEDLDLNLKQTLMSKSDKTEAKQKITLLKNLNKRLDITKNQDIEKQLQLHECGSHN